MSNKTPFEIRYDLLKMSQDYFEAIAEANQAFAKQAFDLAVKDHLAKPTDWQKFVPTAYTMEDVLAKAEELYKFVSKK